MFTRAFWKAAAERAISAGCAAVAAGSVLTATTGIDVAWLRTLATTFVIGALFSLVKGLAANAANGGTGPGIGPVEVLPEEEIPVPPSPAEEVEQPTLPPLY